MDEETLKAAISLTFWALNNVKNNRDIDEAIYSLKRIYCFLTDTELEDNMLNTECCSDHIYESYCPCCTGDCDKCSEEEDARD